MLGWYVPATHAVQALAPAALELPAAHGVHVSDSPTANAPAPHCVAEVAPSAHREPGGHGVHVVVSTTPE